MTAKVVSAVVSQFKGLLSGGGIVSGSRSLLLDLARAGLGKPYVWGGTTPAGWDCSGYVGYLLSRFGIAHPRTAAQMQSYFPATTQPKPGDLMFRGNPAHHVMMYAGNGMVYEAKGRKWGTVYDSVGSYTSAAKIPMYEKGGYVPETGLALLHAGEWVLNASQVSGSGHATTNNNQRSVTNNITVNQHFAQAPSTAMSLSAARAQYGRST
jgi:cell wall-associated NlpC family hydrolase